MSYVDAETGERCPVGSKLPQTKADWHAKRLAVDTVLDDVGGIVTRVGDETVGEMWSLYDGQDVLNEIDPAYSEHIRHHVRHAAVADPFHVSANTDPKGDRSRRPQDQDPDVLLRVVGETDSGIVVRGAKFETAAAYANQAFVKPTIGDWGSAELSEYAVGFVADMAAPGITHICRSSFAGRRPTADYPLSNRFDEIDTMIVFDDVEIPWQDVFFHQHTRAAAFIRATLHRYSMFPFVQRHLRFADLLVGTAYASASQTGHQDAPGRAREAGRAGLLPREHQRPPDRRDRARRAEPGRPSDAQPGAARDRPRRRLHPASGDDAPGPRPVRRAALRDARTRPRSTSPEIGPLLQKYYRVGRFGADDRRRLFAFARDLLNSDYAGHRLTFQLFAQSPAFAHLLHVYNTYDFSGPADLVRRYAGLSEPLEAAGMTGGEPITVGGHLRVRPFNTRDTYPEQRIGQRPRQAVVAGDTIYLRGQVAQDLDTRENVAVGDPAGQAERVMDNVELLLARVRRGARAHRLLPRVPDRHPPPRAGLPRAGRAPGRRASGVHGPRRAGARTARVAGRGDRDRGAAVTLSLVGCCARTGMLGAIVMSSSPAVAARCAWARCPGGRRLHAEHHRPVARRRPARPHRRRRAGARCARGGRRRRRPMPTTAS